MIPKFGIFIFLFFNVILSGAFACNCDVYEGTLTCSPGTIEEFPEDVLKDCTYDVLSVKDIQIGFQPFTLLKSDAFANFIDSNLTAIALEFNEINRIESDAFRGLENTLETLYLKDNSITEIESGAFDNLVKLEVLDVRHNNNLINYTTTSWNLRLRIAKATLLYQGDMSFILDFNIQDESINNMYCEKWESRSECQIEEGVANCVGQSHLDIEDSICSLKREHNLHSVMMDFPMDISPGETENFFDGESASFIRNFNSYGTNQDMSYAKLRPIQTFYGTKFDISSLETLTSNRTQEVTIKADTITISQPMQIHYKLRLVARVVVLTHPITMIVKTKNLFNSTASVEPWTFSEKFLKVNHELTLRERKFGLIEIMDEIMETSEERSPAQFFPIVQNATTQKISPWVDRAILNLQYICGRTLLTSKSNIGLAASMSNFALRLLNDSSLVNNQAIFNTAQKFKRLQQQSQQTIVVHNVPSYTLETIKQLAQTLHTSMNQYRANEIVMEERLFGTTARMQDMNQHFLMVEAQQEMYFQTEMTQLEAIWADSSNQWAFDNEHREMIKNQTNDGLNAMSDAIFEMQNQEYTELLSKAESSVAHLESVVIAYQAQVDRLTQKAEASVEVQNYLSNELNEYNDDAARVSETFKNGLQKWSKEQAAKAVLGFVKAVKSVFTLDFVSMGEGILEAEDAGSSIRSTMNTLKDLNIKINELIRKFEGMSGVDLGDITNNMDSEFSTALKNSVDLKMKGPEFDSVESIATIDIANLQQSTDYNLEGATELMGALKGLSDVGKRLVNEVSDFADILLQLAASQDQLNLAIEDKDRAVEEVKRINSMIEELKEAKRLFEEDRLAAMTEYESKLAQMKEEYINMTDTLRAQYREEITARFDQFKETFNQGRETYLNAIGNLMDSIHLKNLALKDNSMVHRAMIMTLYADFCEAQYYHSFTECTATQTPIMGDEFETLLKKLGDIEWETITSSDKLPIPPTNFGDIHPEILFITDSTEFNISVPVEMLKNESQVDINLYQYNKENFDRFWRIRLDMIRVVLLDKEGEPVPSPDGDFGETIKILITFPTLFNDTDISRNRISFLSQDYLCPADYYVDKGAVMHVSQCEVDAEFTNTNYKPAPDGYFTITIINPDEFPIETLERLRVEFSGSYIPYSPTETNWFSA